MIGKTTVLFAIILYMSIPADISMASKMKRQELPIISVSSDRLRADVIALSSIKPARNYRNIQSLNRAAHYITSRFEEIGCDLSIQRFHAAGNEYRNIICSFGPADAERIVVGAHYDVCDEQPGADDNASGVAGLLEVARLIRELKPNLSHRIDLVAYTLEEPPFFRTEYMGSFVHANSLKESNAKIKVMMSLEMLGYFSDKPGSQSYPVPLMGLFYPDKADFIAVVGKMWQGGVSRKVKRLMKKASSIDVQSISAPSFVQGIDFSDHMNFWKHGYKAVMITDTAFLRSPHYHEVTDTPETLNFEKMAEVVKGVYWAVVNME